MASTADTACVQVTGYRLLERVVMRKVYIRSEVCIGGGLCRVYCQTEHLRAKDRIKAFKREVPHPLPDIRVET